MHFFFRDGDEKLAEGATHMDDIDMFPSPKDGALVVVAQKHGEWRCQICGGPFNEEDPRFRGQEVKMGGARMWLHGRCHARHARAGQNLFQICWNKIRGMQIRRSMAEAARASQGVVDAAEGSASKIIA